MKRLHLNQPSFWAAFFSFPLFVIGNVGATALANWLAGWNLRLIVWTYVITCKNQPYSFFWPDITLLTVFGFSVALPFLVIALLWKWYRRHKWVEFLSIALITTLCQYLIFAASETVATLHLDPFQWASYLPFSSSFFSAIYICWFSYGLTHSFVIIPAFIGLIAFFILLKRTGSLKNCYPAFSGLLCGLAVELAFFVLFSWIFMR